MRPCGWWARWWHRRRRRADHQFMWTALRAKADGMHPDDQERAVQAALRAWYVFIQQPGQEHWLCDCAEQDVLPVPVARRPERLPPAEKEP